MRESFGSSGPPDPPGVPAPLGTTGTGTGAWDALYRSHYGRSVRLAGLLVGDYQLGEEIAQDAFARLLEAGDRVDNPPAYLRGTVVNLSRSRIRRAVMVRRHPEPPPGPQTGPEEDTDRLAARGVVRKALMGLPRRQREAVVLRYYADLSEAEVAAAMGVAPGSVKTHLHRALSALSESLEELR